MYIVQHVSLEPKGVTNLKLGRKKVSAEGGDEEKEEDISYRSILGEFETVIKSEQN